jgi:hypothetical protein
VLSACLELEAVSLCDDASRQLNEDVVVVDDDVARMISMDEGEEDAGDELELGEIVGAMSETSNDKSVDRILCCWTAEKAVAEASKVVSDVEEGLLPEHTQQSKQLAIPPTYIPPSVRDRILARD